jgi:hypothetical protein
MGHWQHGGRRSDRIYHRIAVILSRSHGQSTTPTKAWSGLQW